MKKIMLPFCSLFLLIAGTVQAQRNGAQIRAGLNLANISVNDDGGIDDANTLSTFQVGVLTDIKLASIVYLQPGLIFSGKGAKVERGTEGSLGYFKATVNPYYIEIPATVLLKLPLSSSSSFIAGAGPYAGIGISGKRKFESELINNERSITFSDDDPTSFSEEEGAGFGVMRRFDYGFNATVGLESKSVVLSANYGYGLAKLQSGSDSDEDNGNKNRLLSFTLGFKL